jgi:PhoH-like ATPase
LAKHIYIIDTCVLLHDPLALYKFKENDIYIPLAVIDDLDDIKTKRDNIGFAAREVFRQLENYTLQDLIKGVKINDENGKIFVYNTESPLQKNERPNIVKVHSDNAIIECCLALKTINPRKKVCIVTKDTGLRIRAITWGCNGENYKADLLDVQDYTGIRQIQCLNDEDWKKLWATETVEISQLSTETQESMGEYSPNEFLIFNYGESKCPTYNKNGVLKVLKEKSNADRKAYMGIEGKNLEQKCALEALYDKTVPLVTLTGKAGCGKSFLAIASSLQQINEGTYEKIIVMKPLIPVGGKDIGALPGDKFEKISAWLGPIKDNIDQIIGSKSLSSNNVFEEMVREGIIEVEAMAYIQGRSIAKTIILLDECLVAGSMIYMADGSVKKIEDVIDGDEVVSFDTEHLSWTSNKVSNKFSRQTEELIEIQTSKGLFKCTPSHQLWVYENGTQLVKKFAKDVKLSDLIPVANQLHHEVKNNLSVYEAGLLALVLTDGHICKNSTSIKIDFSKDQEWLEENFKEFSKDFSKTVSGNQSNARKNMICRINNKSEVVDFVKKHNLKTGNKANFIEVPSMIWNAPIESVKKFIQICFDCEGDVNIEKRENCVDKAVISFNSTSKNFTYQLQALLLKFEIDSHIYVVNKASENANTQYRLSIVGGFMCTKFGKEIGFSIRRKQAAVESIYNQSFECTYHYPKISVFDFYESLENDSRWNKSDSYKKSDFNNDMGYNIKSCKGSAVLQKTIDKTAKIAQNLDVTLDNAVICAKINKIEILNETCEVYDFTVENTHTFVVNGMLSSNCQNITNREARMVVERCGKDSKVILLGDLSQVENPYLDAQSNGLAHAVNGGMKSHLVASILLRKVERSELASVASEIFNRPERRR